MGSQRLHDQLVWDVNNTEHDPDSVAQVLCRDLSADQAFVPLVAWHIRQQVDVVLYFLTRYVSYNTILTAATLSATPNTNTPVVNTVQATGAEQNFICYACLVHNTTPPLLHYRSTSTEGQETIPHPAQSLIQLHQTSHKPQPGEPEGSHQ